MDATLGEIGVKRRFSSRTQTLISKAHNTTKILKSQYLIILLPFLAEGIAEMEKMKNMEKRKICTKKIVVVQ
jgi:uracil phosphoribosyltransferase